MAKYFIGFLLAVGLIVVVVVLIIRGLSAPGKKPTALDLPSYANSDVKVQFTIEGPIDAPDIHDSVVMTVDNTQAALIVTKGYDGNTVRAKSYPMTTSAYAVFLRSLSFNGFTKGNNNPALRDERGRCALGDRYVYQVLDGTGNELEHYWHTTCNNGTFGGNVSAVRQLFILQFPDYSTLVNGAKL